MPLFIKGVPETFLGSFTTANLPTTSTLSTVAPGDQAYATDGRKNGEGSGAGTGVLCYRDASAWRRVSDDTTVVA